jgi:uncharacterized protein
MHFVIACVDKPESLSVRKANREAHVAFLKSHASQIVAAGPTLTEDSEGMTGSVLVMEFPDRAAAEAFAAGDPYAQAGLFESVTIKPWRKVFPPDNT